MYTDWHRHPKLFFCFYKIILICMCVLKCHVYQVPTEARRDNCIHLKLAVQAVVSGCQELNSDPLKEQQEL